MTKNTNSKQGCGVKVAFSIKLAVFQASSAARIKLHCQWPKFQTCYGH